MLFYSVKYLSFIKALLVVVEVQWSFLERNRRLT